MAWEIVNVTGCESFICDTDIFENIAFNGSNNNLYIGSFSKISKYGTNFNTVTGHNFYPNNNWTTAVNISNGGNTIHIDYCYEVVNTTIEYGFRYVDLNFLSTGTASTSNPPVNGLIFVVNHDSHYGAVCRVAGTPNDDYLVITQMRMNGSSVANYLYNIINPNIAPSYNWKSWTSLRGNEGRYRASLTKIKEDSIGDFSGQITGSLNDMDYISSQVDMIPVVQNMLYDIEQTIAWSGSDCWLTLTIHEVSGQPTKAQLMFKFYARGHSTTTPLFSFASEIGVTGTVPDKHFYLAFVYDDENYAALFCPVRVTNADSYIWGYANALSDTDMLNIWQWLHMSDAGEDDRPDNPYDVGTPDNGGTDGVIQPPDEVNPGQLPTLDATTKGLFTVYLPTETQLGDIASFMWSDDVIDNFKKYFNNFNQNILALYVLPYAPTNPPTKPFKVGRIESDTITAVGYLNQRFVSIDMGEFTVKPRWGSYLDYAPYTKFEIYLPGIGMQVLDTDDIMSVTDKDGNVSTTAGSIISLEYHLDLITGVCVAYVKINNDVKYQFPGKLGYTIPLTGEDYGRMITAFATVAAGVAGGIAYGGISAPLKNPAIGHMVGGEVSAAVAGTVNAMKPEIHRSGNLSCEASALSTDTPYLIRSMPNKPELVNQQVFTGFPSYKSGVLSDFDGYTECLDAHVEGISCTEEERNMLIEWLRKGVIL